MAITDIFKQATVRAANLRNANIEQYLAAESRAARDIHEAVEAEIKTLKMLKKEEKVLNKISKRLKRAVGKKAKIRVKYEVLLQNAERRGDPNLSNKLRRKMYKKMARVSRRSYKKILSLRAKIGDLPNLEQNFSQTNQKLFSEISALELGLRQEAEAERRAA